jgi:VWFA-related protein
VRNASPIAFVPFVRFIAVVSFVLFVSLVPFVSLAQPPFRSSIDLIEVDVIVQDKAGHFINDLKREDFDLRDSGTSQRIDVFYVVDASTTAGLTDKPAPPDSAPAGSVRSKPKHVFVAFFDDDQLTPAGFKRVQSAALALFAKQFQEGDAGGVVRNGQMANNRLTTSREELIKSVRDASPNSRQRSRQFEERTWPQLTEVEAVRIASHNDRDVLSVATSRACEDDPKLCQFAELAVLGKATQLADAARAASTQALQRLLALLNGLTRIDGRKSVLLLSEGFLADDSWPLVKDAVAVAARANARIYTLDARGLDRSRMGDRLIGDNPGTSDWLARLLDQADHGSDAINSLAVDTGGFVVRNTNILDASVAWIGADAARYYVLGFRPERADGQYRPLAVTVNRPGLIVRARRGYVAARSALATRTDSGSVPGPADSPRTESTVPGIDKSPAPVESTAIPESAVLAAPAIVPLTASAEAAAVKKPDTDEPASAPLPSTNVRVRPRSEEHILSLAPAASRDADADLGWEAYRRGDVEAAQRSLNIAAAHPSAAPWVHYALGQSDYALKQYTAAVAAWETVRSASPEFQPVYFDLVDGYLQLKDYDKAIRVMRAAKERWPHDPEVFNALGVVQVARGALDDAVGSFQQAIATAPTEGTAYFNLAKTLELRYRNSRHYIKQLGRWIANEHDRTASIENYKRYLEIGGPFESAARQGLSRLSWQ